MILKVPSCWKSREEHEYASHSRQSLVDSVRSLLCNLTPSDVKRRDRTTLKTLMDLGLHNKLGLKL